MNNILTTTFTEVEVEKALRQMKPLKSPGPDGIPQFFKVIGLWWEKMLKKLS